MTIVTPTFNLNGTSSETLIAEVEHALDAVRSAIRAGEAMTINGRDFRSALDTRAAISRHQAELAKLREVSQYLAAYWETMLDKNGM